MATQVSMPDGTVLNFPDGVPEEEMRQAAESYHASTQQAAPTPQQATTPQKSTSDKVIDALLYPGDVAISAGQGTGKVGAGIIKRANELGGDSVAAFYRTVLPIIRPDLADEFKSITSKDISQSTTNAAKAIDKNARSDFGKFIGEVGPYAGIGGGSLAAGIKGILQAAGYGAAGGSAAGYFDPYQDGQGAALGNAAKGAAIGGTLGAGIKGASEAIPAVAGKAKSLYQSLAMSPEERAVEYVKKALAKEGGDPQAIVDRITNASETGIPLTLPEAADNLKLMNAQKIVSKGTSPGARTLRDFDAERFTKTIPESVQNAIKGISPNTSLDAAGRGAAEAAESAFSSIRKARSEKATPIYNEAFKVDLPEESFNKLAQDPVIADAISTMRNKPIYQKDLGSLPDNNYKVLQRLREVIGDKSSIDSRGGATTASHLYDDSQAALTNEMSINNPLWDQARKIYSSDSKAIESLKSDTLGTLKDLNTGNYEKAIPAIFNDTAEGIARSRATLSGQNPQVWDDVLAAHMQNNLDRVRDGGFRTLYNNVYGNSLVRQKYQAAMSPEQYQGFSKLMEGVKDSLKVNLSGSDTHFNQISQSAFNDELGSGVAQAAKSWYNIPGKLAEIFDQRAIEKNSEALAKLFTSPNLATLAKDLATVKKGSPEYYSKLGNFIASETGAGVSPALSPNYQTSAQ